MSIEKFAFYFPISPKILTCRPMNHYIVVVAFFREDLGFKLIAEQVGEILFNNQITLKSMCFILP